MAYEPAMRRSKAAPEEKRGGSISCMLFLAGMGAAFWAGTLWASQAWLGW
jgi:hypothetical protein